MSDDRESRRAYQRGYSAGSHNRWPEYHPPIPPNRLMGQVVQALVNLRNAIDGELAKFGEDDEICNAIYPHMDAATEALVAIGRFAKEQPKQESRV
jgi:hypothetical protein